MGVMHMFKRFWQSILVFAVVASAAAPVFAQGYVGMALGANFFNDADYFDIEDDSTAFEIKGGFRLVDVLALEMSYLNLGEFRDFHENIDLGFSGVTISGKAILPLNEQMELYAKMGVYFWELDEKYRRQSYLIDEGEDLIFGGGASFYLSSNVSVDLEYRRLEITDLESDLFTAGITLSF